MRELIAQAEALEWVLKAHHLDSRLERNLAAAAKGLRAQAEQPAEPQGEPVAHGFAPNGDGKITDALVVGHNDDPEYNIPLYRRPDPRVSMLEALLRELHALVKGESPQLLDEDRGGDGKLALEIAAALGEG